MILKEQSGRIMVRNNPEGGATFSIWLPEADPDSLAASEGETQLKEAEVPS